jgi:hypothetical protein
LLGTALLAASNLVVGIVYLGLGIVQYVHCRYLACTRCYYYGKNCYMLGGDCAKLLFKQREQGARMPDDAIIGLWWAVITIFPIPFFVYWRSWVFLAVYLVISLGWHLSHHFIACRRCHNTNCPLNAAQT